MARWAARLAAHDPVEPLGNVTGDELVSVYAPLAALLTGLSDAGAGPGPGGPLIVGIAGSVAVGKSTTAVALRHLLAPTLSVEIVSTDGFLLSNAALEQRNLTLRKGFPESYDTARLIAVLGALRAGERHVVVPLYDHRVYDVIADRTQVVDGADIVLLEGVNALAAPAASLLDLGIYVDADSADIRAWFVERFLDLAARAVDDPGSFFSRWSGIPTDQLVSIAEVVWDQINAVNLADHILPTRQRAQIVLVKDADHRVREVLIDPALW